MGKQQGFFELRREVRVIRIYGRPELQFERQSRTLEGRNERVSLSLVQKSTGLI